MSYLAAVEREESKIAARTRRHVSVIYGPVNKAIDAGLVENRGGYYRSELHITAKGEKVLKAFAV